MVEEWRTVVGHPQYEVSNLGRVRSLGGYVKRGNGYFKKRGRILRQLSNKTGHRYVHLRYGVHKKAYVHRLVALSFVKNDDPSTNTVVNHIDFDPQNNESSNLEWTTPKGNMHHSFYAGRYKRTKSWLQHLRETNEKNGKSVIGKELKTGNEITYVCLNDCEKDGFNPSCVCNCCQGKRATHKGYKWRYKDEQDI